MMAPARGETAPATHVPKGMVSAAMTPMISPALMCTNLIFGCGKIPAERLSERLRVAIVPLVEQEEFVALAKWHAVTEPSARELVIKLHIFTFLQLLCLPLGNRLRLPFEGTSITSHYSV